jgi:hypothetical protein
VVYNLHYELKHFSNMDILYIFHERWSHVINSYLYEYIGKQDAGA